jgi:Amt family ammonium transporter
MGAMAQPSGVSTVVLAEQPPVVASVEVATTTAAVTPAAPVALKRPGLVEAEKINGADSAWMMTSTALVLLMTLPGIALFYGGMVRKKNVINTMAAVLVVAAVVTVTWFAMGYSLAFTPGNGFVGGLDRAFFDGYSYIKDKSMVAVSHAAPNIPESVYAMFQLTFAIITTALIVGAVVERMRFGAWLAFAVAWSLLVYAPVAHWVWEPGGWLNKMGVLDFAGGSVVHINAGASGLVLAYILGPRRGYGREPFEPYNLALTMVGTGLLWVGWFGFNAGSAVASDGRAGLAMLVTHLAAATAALSWMACEWLSRRTCSMLGLCSGAVGGLVAITPASGYVSAGSALVIGAVAGVVCYWGATQLKRLLRVDDSLDVFGIHAVGGFTGAILTGVFNDPRISGVEASVAHQFLGAISVMLYSMVMTAILVTIVLLIFRLRVDEAHEAQGLDISLHRERIGT